MSNEEQNEGLLELAVGLAQLASVANRAAVAAGVALSAWLRENQEEIESARAVIEAAANGVVSWAKEHEGELRALSAAVEEAGGADQYVEQALERLRQLPEDFKQGDYEIALMVVRFAEMADLATGDADELHDRLYDYSTRPELQEWVLELYDRTGLRKERRSQLEEALALHNTASFWASVPVLIAAFEGIVTDALVDAGFAEADESGVYLLEKNGQRKKDRNGRDRTLSGIWSKLEVAELASDDEENRFKNLKTIELTYGEPNSKLNRVRNGILHGHDTEYPTEKRSTQFVFSIYAVLEELVYSGILEDRQS